MQQTIRLRLRSTDKLLMGRERCIGFKGATFRNSSSSVEEYLTKTSSEILSIKGFFFQDWLNIMVEDSFWSKEQQRVQTRL